MAFGVGQVVTNVGKGILAKRLLGATPSQLEPKYVGVGVGATGAARTAAVGDSALTTENTGTEPRSGANAGTTVTTTQTNDTYQVAQTINVGATRAFDEAGLFDASTAGNMFVSATYNVISLVSGDQITLTFQVQFT